MDIDQDSNHTIATLESVTNCFNSGYCYS